MNAIVNMWLQARFVMHPLVMLMFSVLTSFVLWMLVMASQTSTVHEAGVSCAVREFTSSPERVSVKLDCDTTTGTVSAWTNHGATVLAVLQTGAARIKCDVYVAGNVGNCVVPQAPTVGITQS